MNIPATREYLCDYIRNSNGRLIVEVNYDLKYWDNGLDDLDIATINLELECDFEIEVPLTLDPFEEDEFVDCTFGEMLDNWLLALQVKL